MSEVLGRCVRHLCTCHAGDVQVVQGVYMSCRGCTGRAGGVQVVQGVYRSCRGCTIIRRPASALLDNLLCPPGPGGPAAAG